MINGFEVGDVVTAYGKGIWRITNIRVRQPDVVGGVVYNTAPLVTVEKLLNDNRRTLNPKTDQCDMGFCRKITNESLDKEIEEFLIGIQNVRNLL